MSGPNIVTFYSYKGGTGRSMALANVAWILASSGKRVLIIDWDLEAPGLHRYFHPFLADKELVRSEGLIDFVMHYAELAVAKGRRPKNWYKPHANILRYASSLNYTFPQKGTIDFVPAGRQGSDYATRVNAFNWQHFYEKLSGGMLLEAAKLGMADYEYVLIDSRTGVSDTSGICTVQMPNVLVVCFTLNTQSIEGAAAVAESADMQRRNEKGERTLRIMPVPTRVERTETAKLNAGMEAARKRFDPLLWHLDGAIDDYWASVAVQYQPFYAYEEVLAVFGDAPGNTQSMLASMEALAGRITSSEGAFRLPPIPAPDRLALLGRYLRQQQLESPYVIRRQTEHSAPVRALAISPDGKWVVSADHAGTARVWNLETGRTELKLTGHTGAIRAVAFSGDGGHVFTGGDDKTIQMWPFSTAPNTLPAKSWAMPDPVYALAASSDCKKLVVGAGNAVSVVEINRVSATQMGAHNLPVWAVSVSGSSKFAVSASFDRILIAWDLELGSPRRTFSGHTGEVGSVALSSDGRLVLSGSYDNTLKLWDFESGAPLRTFEGHSGSVQSVALSPDSKLAVSAAADRMVNVWDLQTGVMLLQLSGHTASVNAVAVSPDGRRIVSGSDDGGIIVWNAEGIAAPAAIVAEVSAEDRPGEEFAASVAPADDRPLVYLSFSRQDRDRYFRQFVEDLEKELQRLSPGAPAIFWWDDSLTYGDTWPGPVMWALCSARVAVTMVSPKYLQSSNCGREFAAIQMRIDAGSGKGVYPIVWEAPTEWPAALRQFQIDSFEFSPSYRKEGLAFMMRLSRHRDDYATLVSRFAEDIVKSARTAPLLPVAELPPIDSLPNAFLASAQEKQPSLESQLVFLSVPAQRNFGKPLTDVIAEVTGELDVTTAYAHPIEIAGLIERTARANDILLIVADRQSGSIASHFPSAAYTDDSLVAHCALIVINADRNRLPVEKPPKGIGFFAGDIRSEGAFRDALRTGIIKIQNALIAKANLDQGPVGGSGPDSPDSDGGGDEGPNSNVGTHTPSLPSTS